MGATGNATRSGSRGANPKPPAKAASKAPSLSAVVNSSPARDAPSPAEEYSAPTAAATSSSIIASHTSTDEDVQVQSRSAKASHCIAPLTDLPPSTMFAPEAAGKIMGAELEASASTEMDNVADSVAIPEVMAPGPSTRSNAGVDDVGAQSRHDAACACPDTTGRTPIVNRKVVRTRSKKSRESRSERPGSKPRGNLARPFDPGWGDSRSLPPFMSLADSHTRNANRGGDGRGLIVMAAPASSQQGSTRKAHLRSPRSRPQTGYATDAYLSFVEAGDHLTSDQRVPTDANAATTSTLPAADSSAPTLAGHEATAAARDEAGATTGMVNPPSSPGAPGTGQRARYKQACLKSSTASSGLGRTDSSQSLGAPVMASRSLAALPSAASLRKAQTPSFASGSENASSRRDRAAQQAKLQSQWSVGLASGTYAMHGPLVLTPPPLASTRAPPPPIRGTSSETGPSRSERVQRRVRREDAEAAPHHTSVITGYEIDLRELRAFNVPDADIDDPTDPYVLVELLETDDMHLTTYTAASARTSVATVNPTNPVWGRQDNLTIVLPAGSPAALAHANGVWPTVRISIFDKDYGDEDDLLGKVRSRPAHLRTKPPDSCNLAACASTGGRATRRPARIP